jgi:hypothetical protein
MLTAALVLGCGPGQPTAAAGFAGAAGSSSAAGSSNTAGGSSAAAAPDESASWIWAACGAIASEVFPGLLPEYQPGQAIKGGHPFSSGLDGSSRITALAMSADGQTLASMGGVALLWSVAPSFVDSRAVYLDHALPEWPRLALSPDGRWLAISGDGWRLVSREGERGPFLSLPHEGTCWPAQLIFSPDGQWLVGTGFGPGIGVFRVADLEQPSDLTLTPFASLPAPCGPAGAERFLGPTTRLAFTPDSQALVTETGARYRTNDWQLVADPQLLPLDHGLSGALTVSPDGTPLLSDCLEGCRPYPGRFPQYNADGTWILAGGTLTHVRTGSVRVLDPSSPVGIFTPNGDIIAASEDNTLTRYCRSE